MSMTRRFRWFAAVLLALLLPAQGWAAACAQICAQARSSHHEAAMQSDADAATRHHCESNTQGAGKCCQAHVFLVMASVPEFTGAHEHLTPDAAAAPWVNFIPDSPHHPPIASPVIA
jgi:hypothetical protein